MKLCSVRTAWFFVHDGEEVEYSGISNDLFKELGDKNKGEQYKTGIWAARVEYGKLIEEKYDPYSNPELLDMNAQYMMLYEYFGVLPKEDSEKEQLKKDIKQTERLRKTLVYACYTNDMEAIRERVKDAKPSHLKKKIKYTGTGLTLLAEHNNVEGFRLLVEAGADFTQDTLSGSPLELAFSHSPDIVNYIKNEHTEVYEELMKKNKRCYLNCCRDKELMLGVLKYFDDYEMNGNSNPPLNSFVQTNNMVGVETLLEQGVSINIVDSYGRTPLYCAIYFNKYEMAKYLIEHGADMDIETKQKDTSRLCLERNDDERYRKLLELV